MTILEKHYKTKAKNQYDSKDFLKDLINTDLKLFKGIELTMHIMCASAVMVSVESEYIVWYQDMKSILRLIDSLMNIELRMKWKLLRMVHF